MPTENAIKQQNYKQPVLLRLEGQTPSDFLQQGH